MVDLVTLQVLLQVKEIMEGVDFFKKLLRLVVEEVVLEQQVVVHRLEVLQEMAVMELQIQ
jgi:hypothetical protein